MGCDFKMGLNLKEFAKHAIGGGLVIAILEPKIEKYAREKEFSPDERDIFTSTAVGAVGGGVLGYYLGERVANHKRNYTLEEKAISTALGSAGGGVAGYVLSSYLVKRMNRERNEVQT